MIVFSVLAVLMVVGAVLVVTLRRPVHAALALVGTLITLAVAYVQLNAHFLAAIQVIVYAGAIMVLFLFVIMLLNVSGIQGGTGMRLPGMRAAAWAMGALAIVGVMAVTFLDPRPTPEPEAIAAAIGGGNAGAIGDVLFTRFLLPFHLVGVLLLTGIVGAVGLVQRDVSAAADEQARAGMPFRTPGEPPPADLPGRVPVGAAGDRS